MNIVSSVNDWQEIRRSLANKTIGYVPTMGNLHAGHMSLCERAQRENEITVVSIFVNPTQFNEAKDFEFYPRTLEQDRQHLASIEIDYLLTPSADALYPDQFQMRVLETELSNILEGEFRPGHFSGMLTIVLKLLNLVQPTRAYFGEKDYQQYLLIKKMAAAFFLPVEIIPCATVRAEDGLALSSRNSRMTIAQREKAPLFAQLLASYSTPSTITKQLEQAGFKVEYISDCKLDQSSRRLGAVWLDDIRLIDNIVKEAE